MVVGTNFTVRDLKALLGRLDDDDIVRVRNTNGYDDVRYTIVLRDGESYTSADSDYNNRPTELLIDIFDIGTIDTID